MRPSGEEKMTKEWYLKWKANRPADHSQWDEYDAKLAERCVRENTLWNLRCILERQSVPTSVVEFVVSATSNTFEDPDTNSFLNDMNAYPEWI
jgi:hypothetical protein